MAEQQAAAPARALADATLDRLRDRVGSAPDDGEARLALARGLIAAGDAAAAGYSSPRATKRSSQWMV